MNRFYCIHKFNPNICILHWCVFSKPWDFCSTKITIFFCPANCRACCWLLPARWKNGLNRTNWVGNFPPLGFIQFLISIERAGILTWGWCLQSSSRSPKHQSPRHPPPHQRYPPPPRRYTHLGWLLCDLPVHPPHPRPGFYPVSPSPVQVILL